MSKTAATYSFRNKLSALIMMFTLAWLMVSLPAIMVLQDEAAAKASICIEQDAGNTSDDGNTGVPGCNTDEKAPGGLSNLSEEFLHQHHHNQHQWLIVINKHQRISVPTYHSYHGELLVPPPNFLLS